MPGCVRCDPEAGGGCPTLMLDLDLLELEPSSFAAVAAPEDRQSAQRSLRENREILGIAVRSSIRASAKVPEPR